MLFQGQCFTVWLVSPRGAVLRRCSGAESWLSSERLANLGRACGHGLCPGSLSTLSRTTSPWWQESLVLLMWYFLLSFGRETGHLCCHHLLLSPQRPYKREQIPCMLTTGFPEPFLPFSYFHPPGRFLWNQKKEAKVSWPLRWGKDEMNFPEMALKAQARCWSQKERTGVALSKVDFVFPSYSGLKVKYQVEGNIPNCSSFLGRPRTMAPGMPSHRILHGPTDVTPLSGLNMRKGPFSWLFTSRR